MSSSPLPDKQNVSTFLAVRRVTDQNRKKGSSDQQASGSEDRLLELARTALTDAGGTGRRTAIIQDRLSAGYYTSPEMAREVAMRIVVDLVLRRS